MAGRVKIVRIGGASSALNDSAIAPPGRLSASDLNYFAFDCLAERAMGLFRRMKKAKPVSGFLSDFFDVPRSRYLTMSKTRGIRLTANAGGVNLESFAAVISQRALTKRVAFVHYYELEHLVHNCVLKA